MASHLLPWNLDEFIYLILAFGNVLEQVLDGSDRSDDFNVDVGLVLCQEVPKTKKERISCSS